jgi:hypothetical protein
MQTLHDQLNQLTGLPVNVLVDGGLSIKGMITGVFEDYVAVQKNSLTYFIQVKNIKEITKSVKYQLRLNLDGSEPLLIDQQRFSTHLKNFEQQWIAVTRSGLEEFQGFLSLVNEDYAVFITKENIKFVPVNQIISFYVPDTQSDSVDGTNDDRSTEQNEAAVSQKKSSGKVKKNDNQANNKRNNKNSSKVSRRVSESLLWGGREGTGTRRDSSLFDDTKPRKVLRTSLIYGRK